MPRRMSNKDRIRKRADEAAAKKKAKKKTAKKAAKKTTKKKAAKAVAKKKVAKKKTKASRGKKSAEPVRMKIVWAVTTPTLKIVKVFPYPEKKAAQAEAARLTKSKKVEHKVRPEKVPMED